MAERRESAAQALERLFEKALERPSGERDAWLDQAIDDPGLRRRVRSLVRRAETMGDFLERPAAWTLRATATASTAPPETIGPYRIAGTLGEGGMGVVYLAEQREPVARRLALKVLRAGLATPAAAARFEAERRILARLGHPSIAVLHDAGTTADGRLYFAMEYVDGPPLTVAADAERLSLEARIELFLEVCDAVRHAHQKGILHHDLKPSNVLAARLGDRLVPKVIDFGIARALDRDLDSDLDSDRAPADAAGTPAYMSPERFDPAADPDVRSDVYSLGILLSELLAAVRPQSTARPCDRFDESAPQELERIAAARGLDPRRLRRRLRGDLEAIIARSTARDPEQRYPSVTALAADLGRYLRLEPVEASAPGWRDRLVKLARRRRAAFAAAVISLLALLAGTIGTTVGMVRAGREAVAARAAQAEAEELTRFLTGLFEVSDPDRSRGEDLRVRELLDRAAVEVRSSFPEQPLSRARFERTLGDVFVHLGLYDDARPLLEESRTLVESAAPDEPRELAAARRSLGLLAWRDGRHGEAEALLRSALDLRHGEADPATATLLNDLAVIYLDQQRLGEAEPLFRRALAIREARFGRDHPETAMVLGGLGYLLHLRERYAEAESMQREALAIRERRLGPDHPRVAASLNNLGLLELATGRRDQAEASFRRAATIWEKVFGADHPQVTTALNALARVARQDRRPDDAERLYLRCLAILEASYGPDHPRLGLILNNLGVLYWTQERYRDAEPFYRRALDIYRHTLGPDSPRLGFPLSNLGLVQWKLGDQGSAERNLRRTLELWSEPGEADSRRAVWPLWGLAGLTADDGRLEEAENLYHRALRIVDAAPADTILPPVREDFEAFRRAAERRDISPPPR